MAAEVHLVYPTNSATGVAIGTNFTINISSGSAKKVQLYLNGELEQEWEVVNWSGTKYLNPTDDLTVNTEYSWYVKIQDWVDPYDWYQSAETWSFDTNALPSKPVNPTPSDAADDVTLDQETITWEDGGGATSYDVYYGDTSGDLTLVSEGQTGLSFTIDGITLGSPFDYLVTRYWRVDAVNAAGTTTGDEWSFASIAFDPPLPTGVTLNAEGEPTGTPTGESNMITVRKLVVAANDKIWYEDI